MAVSSGHLKDRVAQYAKIDSPEDSEQPGSVKVAPVEGHPNMVRFYHVGGFPPGGQILLLPAGFFLFSADLPTACVDQYDHTRLPYGWSYEDANRPLGLGAKGLVGTSYYPCADVAKHVPYTDQGIKEIIDHAQ